MPVREEEGEDPLYRPAVGMMLVNPENKIFVGQRSDSQDPAWQMPQGGIDLSEETDQAMLRELQEEIGTRNVDIMAHSKTWYKYDLPESLAGRLWNGRFKGQKQIWYALRFRGKDEEINIHTDHPEFRDWKWVDKTDILTLSIFFKKDLYARVLHDLWPYIVKQK